jgi:hypothetical protein
MYTYSTPQYHACIRPQRLHMFACVSHVTLVCVACRFTAVVLEEEEEEEEKEKGEKEEVEEEDEEEDEEEEDWVVVVEAYGKSTNSTFSWSSETDVISGSLKNAWISSWLKGSGGGCFPIAIISQFTDVSQTTLPLPHSRPLLLSGVDREAHTSYLLDGCDLPAYLSAHYFTKMLPLSMAWSTPSMLSCS